MEWLEQAVTSIEKQLWFRVASVLTVFLGGSILALVLYILGRLPFVYRRKYKEVPAEVGAEHHPIKLSPRHCKAPKENSLKGKYVEATGILHFSYTNRDLPIEVSPYPFSIDIDVVCEFDGDDIHLVRRRRSLEFVAIVGYSEDGVTFDDRSECHLRLKHCRVERPNFFTWFRYEFWHKHVVWPLSSRF